MVGNLSSEATRRRVATAVQAWCSLDPRPAVCDMSRFILAAEAADIMSDSELSQVFRSCCAATAVFDEFAFDSLATALRRLVDSDECDWSRQPVILLLSGR